MNTQPLHRWIACALLAVVSSACGSGSDQLTSAQSDGVVDEEKPAPTTSPVIEVTANADGLRPVPDEQSGDEIIALIESLHGPTTDISAELNQLNPFPQVPTPAGAHVMEVGAITSVTTRRPEGFSGVLTSATIKVDEERSAVVAQYREAFAGPEWATGIEESENDTSLRFTKSNAGLGSESFRVIVASDTDLGVTRLKLQYGASDFPDPDGLISARFVGWYGDMPLHDDDLELKLITVGSQFGPGRTKIEMRSEFFAERLPAEEQDEVDRQFAQRAQTQGIEFAVVGRDLEIQRENFERFIVGPSRVSGHALVMTPPFEGLSVVGVEKSNDPLPTSGATATEIQTIVSDIVGPTADVSAQMNRLGSFPDLPTPNGADIIDLKVEVASVIILGGDGDKVRAIRSEVEMFIDGDYDDGNAFYEAQMAALGWLEESNKIEQTDDGLSTVRRVGYRIPGEPDRQMEFDLTITDDVDDARTKVNLSYREIVPTANTGIERWASWFDQSPFPEGGELYEAGISTFGRSPADVRYSATYRYLGADMEEMVDEVEASFAASAYTLTDGEFAVGKKLLLSNPDFVESSVWLVDNFADGARIELKATRDLVE